MKQFFITSIKSKVYLFLLILFFLSPKSVFAADTNFAVSSQVSYTVNANGITHVVFSNSLQNETDKYFASSYTVHLGFKDIKNVTASDPTGAIQPSVKATQDGEDISVTFNKHVFGKNDILPFTIAFDTTEVASLNGAIWEVNIPGLSNASDFANFTVSVHVPAFFGKPSFSKPAGNTSLIYTKDELGTSGISLAFGDKQVYQFHLAYNVQNTQIFPVHTEIALPPNTSYQQIEIDTISPRPDNVVLDTDGNWLAQFSLRPSQKLKIAVTGKAYLSLRPTAQQLTQNEYALFTKSILYWDANNSQIKKLATSLQTPEAIYDYVVKTLQYDFARVSDSQERLGAVGILAHPDQAVCLEFTDLFIAIARAAGIPARELDGYAYTQNTTERPLSLQKEILHAWPEYYDNTTHTWIMVDPTWQNTTGGVDYFHTFDFDHLALSIKGVSSTYPVPAGGYKLAGQEAEKDVVVTFAPPTVVPEPAASFALDAPTTLTAGFPVTASVGFQNTGSVLFPAEILQVQSTQTPLQHVSISPIPPFGRLTVPLTLNKSTFLTNTLDVITIHFAGKTIAKSIHISAFSTPVIIVGGLICATILGFIISLIARKRRHISIL